MEVEKENSKGGERMTADAETIRTKEDKAGQLVTPITSSA